MRGVAPYVNQIQTSQYLALVHDGQCQNAGGRLRVPVAFIDGVAAGLHLFDHVGNEPGLRAMAVCGLSSAWMRRMISALSVGSQAARYARPEAVSNTGMRLPTIPRWNDSGLKRWVLSRISMWVPSRVLRSDGH